MVHSEVFLRCSGISRRWGGLVAVNRVSLELERGSIHALIGTNGAGKSTLINILAGEIAPSSGRVELLGQDVTQWSQPRRARAGLGRSYQRNTIFPSFTVFENCRLAAQARAQKPWTWWRDAQGCEASTNAARAAIRRAGLDGFVDRCAGLLSHGHKRQLEIAMCLATEPKVLLLDEPLAGMGAEEIERMLDLLGELKSGHATLLVEHDMDAVSASLTGFPSWSTVRSLRRTRRRRYARIRKSRRRILDKRALTTEELIVDARNVHAWYGSSHVLQGIQLQIGRGETMGLLGRNGMGKSTLIRSLLGHVKQRDGYIGLFGQDCSRAKPHEVARLGVAYVPEGRGVFPKLTAQENLVMAARRGRDGRNDWTYERVMQTFPRLSERRRNLGAQLSGGEQQMLSIGRALMTNPELLILDEATEGLAPLIVAEIWKVIGDIRASGIATLIVDRDYRKVLARSDRAAVLQKGQIVLHGVSDEVAGSEILAGYLGV